MIRVLTFGRFADRDFGGLERYVFELARALDSAARFTNIVALRGPPPDVALAGETIYARPIATVAGIPICPSMAFHARRLHAQRAFDVVHLQFPADPVAHAAMAFLPSSVKRVITWHSDIVRQKTLFKIYRPFLNRLLASADAIIVPTPAHLSSSKQLESVRQSSKFRVVPYGFDYSRFEQVPPAAERLRALHSNRLLVFALGRHVYYKGFEYLIRGLCMAPDVHIMLGGRGPLTEALTRLARNLGVDNRIEFLGRIPEEELPAYYHACDVYCMPSDERSEAFGIVQLEAMVCGRPVVCCELANGVTWVNRHGETGLVVPPADPQALAIALQRLHHDRTLVRRLGEQARRRARQLFSLDAMSAGTLQVYRDVLKKRR